jgi:hypothetical protein
VAVPLPSKGWSRQAVRSIVRPPRASVGLPARITVPPRRPEPGQRRAWSKARRCPLSTLAIC